MTFATVMLKSVTCEAGEITGDCMKTQVFTYSAVDDCGNKVSETVTYTWKVDLAAPVLPELPEGGYLGCNPTPPTCVDDLIANDVCDGDVKVLCEAGEITGDCMKTQVFTYSAVDECGNKVSETVTYTWKVDLAAPVLPDLPEGGYLGCNPTPPTCVDDLIANDVCDGDVKVLCEAGEITGDCMKTQIFTYSAVDDCGNKVSETVTYTWKVDLAAPVLPDLPEGGYLGCNPTPPTCVDDLIANDVCDGDVKVLCEAGEITGDCMKTQVFTYSAVDDCGNKVSETVTYTWKVDLVAPVLPDLPEGGYLGCNPTPPTCVDDLIANDVCDGDVKVLCEAGEITGDCMKTQVFTYSAVDDCGNKVSETVTYTWKVDLAAPVLPDLPEGGYLGCNPTPPTCVDDLIANDVCDGDVKVLCEAGEITGDCMKTQVFTYSAVDDCGNKVSETVTYTWKVDLAAPVLPDLPEGGYLGCNPTPPTCVDDLIANDVCDGDVKVLCEAGEITGDCLKTQVFTYSAVDDCGNKVSETVTYTWKVDLVAPVLPDLPEGGYLGCNPTPPTCVDDLIANDVCDGDVKVLCEAGEITGDCMKTQVFTYSAVDECGNKVSETVTYTWKVDLVAPVLPDLPEGGYLGCNPTPPTCVDDLIANDVCDGDVKVLCEAGEITGDCMKTQIFTYSAVDDCGNKVSETVTYTWKVDLAAPVLPDLPEGGYLGCNPTPPTCVDDLIANDVCDGDVKVLCEAGEITGDCMKTQIFTYSAVDDCGNKVSETVTYTWKVDLVAPVLPDLPEGGYLGCNPTPPTCVDDLIANDVCDGDVKVLCEAGEITGDCMKTQVFTYSAVDDCGNKVSETVTYTWKVDLAAPVLPELPEGGYLGCNPTPPTCVDDLIANDVCDGDVKVLCEAGEITGDCMKTQIFTYSAVDDCGNKVSETVTYTWKVDLAAPVLPELPEGGYLGCNPTPPTCVDDLIANDVCDGDVKVLCEAGEITGDCMKTQVFTYSAPLTSAVTRFPKPLPTPGKSTSLLHA
jgi:hypothetical protein